MDLVQRVQSILLKPKDEWVKIKAEPATVSGLFTSYAMILAAIPAVAQFIGYVIIGQRIPFFGLYHWGVGRAFGSAILSYVLSLVTVYLFAYIINTLAPNFSSAPSLTNAMKLAVFSMTPGWLAGILYIFPYLGILVILASLYGLYILYLGFETPMMETPKEKILGYIVVSIIVLIVLTIVFGMIVGGIFAVRMR
jgi:hypothetical protein